MLIQEVYMSKQVMISEELFISLCKWHLLDFHDPDLEIRIRAALQDKLDRSLARVEYRRTLSNPAEKTTLN